MIRLVAPALAFLLPLLARAETFEEFVNEQVVPFGDAVVGLIYALAFLFFLIGMLRFFYAQSDEDRAKGRKHMFWGITGLVVLFSVWSLVRLLLSVLPGAGE